jgi:glycosyltransferase involved in cell wall biosynthesis
MKRLLTIGHSYVVAQNRRLAHEMALAGEGEWEVTAAAPEALDGDLRRIRLEPIAGEACRVVPLPVRRGRLAHLRGYGELGPLLREPWDVVHCWEEPYVWAGWQIARGTPRGARFVFATFQNISKSYPFPFGYMEQSVVRRADGWIAFGETVREALIDRPGYEQLPWRVITPGVDVTRFTRDASARQRVRELYGWDDGTPVVGFVGRFVRQKGLRTLISALAATAVPWRALFVGGGPELRTVQAFAASHPGRVAIATDVPHDAVPGYLNAMDILCAPSETTPSWREQFGRMLIEAMACGVAVMASNSGEIPHVVKYAGVLLPEQDVDAWTDGLSRLLSNKGMRADLGYKGRERAQLEFAWPRIAGRHLEFFDELTAGRTAGAAVR